MIAITEKILCFLKRQAKEIRKGGISVLLRKGHTVLLILLAVPVVIVVRILRPLVIIRFGRLRSERIGHFAIDTELYLCERDRDRRSRRTLDIFHHGLPVCNYQLKKMWDRTLHVFPFSRWLDRLNRWLPGGGKHTISMPSFAGDVHGLLTRMETHLSFTHREERMGAAALDKLGIPKDSPFICFSARDSAYLDAVLPNWNWRYHDFRDADIRNYIPAAEELARRGYYMFRMGAVVKEKLDISNPRIIDYAKSYRSDFLDIFLSAKCRFFLSDTAGINEVSRVFRRPVVYANFVPLGIRGLLCCAPGSLFIPKKLWLREDRRFLTFRECLLCADRFLLAKQHRQPEIEVIENTPEEITALAVEMDERLKGTWQTSKEDEDLQRRYRELFPPGHRNYDFPSRIGAEFLRRNQELLK